jgi:hypothetical protein
MDMHREENLHLNIKLSKACTVVATIQQTMSTNTTANAELKFVNDGIYLKTFSLTWDFVLSARKNNDHSTVLIALTMTETTNHQIVAGQLAQNSKLTSEI